MRDWLAGHREQIVAQLADWVRIASVAGAPEYEGELDRSANWLSATLRRAGFPVVEIWSTRSGPPAVFAEWPGPSGAPAVLVYSHHDVRAAKAEDWRTTAPFTPLVRGDRLYGRGSSDAKGQVLAHVWGVLAWLATSGSGAPPVTLRLLVEGEEETGSAHLAELLREQSDRVAADLVVVSDTMTWASDRPAICVGNRGMMKAEVEIRGAASDTHGGAVAGAAPNAADELVRVLAQLHDAGRTVTVPGFYDDVTDPGPDEAAELARLTADQADWLRRTGTGRVHGEPGRSLGELLFTRPALEVLMLAAGDAQPPTTGTMPAAARAELQVSLVPEQHPDRVAAQLESWFAAHVADGFVHRLTVADTVNQPAYLTPPDHPVLEVFARSMAEVWGLPVGRMRNAGGAPTVLLAAAAGAPVAFFGTGLPEDNWHGPDESADLDVLIKGAATLATAWPRLAQRWAPPAS